METLTVEQLQSLDKYSKLRDAVRNTMQYGVEPNIVAALQSYAVLDAALNDELSVWADTHSATTAAVQPHINNLIDLMTQLLDLLHSIAAADTNIFPAITAKLPITEDEV